MQGKLYDSKCALNNDYGLYDYLKESTTHKDELKPYGRVDRSRYAFSYQESSHNYLGLPEYRKIIGDKYCYYFSGDTDKDDKIQRIYIKRIKGFDEIELSVYSMAILIELLGECKKFLDEYPDWKLELSLSADLCADNIERQTYDFDDCFKQVVKKYEIVKKEYEIQRDINRKKANDVLKGIKLYKEKSYKGGILWTIKNTLAKH